MKSYNFPTHGKALIEHESIGAYFQFARSYFEMNRYIQIFKLRLYVNVTPNLTLHVWGGHNHFYDGVMIRF